MSARTARRRRLQARQGWNHLALLGRGNNNRPVYRKKSIATLQRKEEQFREKRRVERARGKKK